MPKYLVIEMHINLIKQVRTSYYKTREREGEREGQGEIFNNAVSFWLAWM